MTDIDKLEGIDLALAVARAQGHEPFCWLMDDSWCIVKRDERGIVVYEEPLPRPDQDLNAAWSLFDERWPYVEVRVDISGTSVGLNDDIFHRSDQYGSAVLATLLCRCWLDLRRDESQRQAEQDRRDHWRPGMA